MATDKRRVNGWSWPPSRRQIATITVCLADGALFCVVLLPLIDGVARWIFAAGFGVVFAALVIAGLRAMTVDPIDPMAAVGERACADDPNVLYCRHCDSAVQLDSKHCWTCQKCVANYDHHCPWINTCVGERNYASFYVSICATQMMLSLVIAAAVLVLHDLLVMNELANDGGTIMVILAAVLAVNVPLWFLVTILMAFHSYLVYENITTYEYLTGKVSKRKQAPVSQTAKSSEAAGSCESKEKCDDEGTVHSTGGDTALPPPPHRGQSVRTIQSESSVASVFRVIVAQESDLAIRRSVSNFVFGFGTADAGDPIEDGPEWSRQGPSSSSTATSPCVVPVGWAQNACAPVVAAQTAGGT